MESLFEYIPREMLPNEYGGNAGEIAELKKIWTDELKVKRQVENYYSLFTLLYECIHTFCFAF